MNKKLIRTPKVLRKGKNLVLLRTAGALLLFFFIFFGCENPMVKSYLSDMNSKDAAIQGGKGDTGAPGTVITVSADGYWVIDGVKTGFRAVGKDGKNSYLVIFNGNGGEPVLDAVGVLHGGTVGSLPAPARTGYIFEGWNTQTDGSGTAFTTSTQVMGNITVYAQWADFMEMVWIPAGSFIMGSQTEPDDYSDERPQRAVTLTQGFYMGKYQVTQGQWEAVIGYDDRLTQVSSGTNYGRGDNYPMYYVSWYNAIVFCNKLSILENLTPAYYMVRSQNDGVKSTDPADWGTVPTFIDARWNAVEIVTGSTGYRLPTEAQWEYACRAGTTGEWSHDSSQHDAYMWYSGNNSGSPGDATYGSKPVGTKLPNPWGLYDMHGNLWEWCWDWYGAYTSEAQTDPVGAPSGYSRILRGGVWGALASYSRSAYRMYSDPRYWGESGPNYNAVLGFRLLRP